jgi:hypothetical protein
VARGQVWKLLKVKKGFKELRLPPRLWACTRQRQSASECVKKNCCVSCRHCCKMPAHLGCQMAYFENKNPDLGKFCRVVRWKMLVYFVAIRSIFPPFGIFYGHLVYFPRFGILYLEKSGNPAKYKNVDEPSSAQICPLCTTHVK